jgi:SAM-dependent methyltransferase
MSNLPTSASRACPVCCGTAKRDVTTFTFGGWNRVGSALERENFTYNIVACETCDHVRILHPYGDRFVEQLYTRPDAQEMGPWGCPAYPTPSESSYREMVEFVGQDLPASGAVLDFGCGRGSLLAEIRRVVNPERLLGVDFQPTLPPDIRAKSLNLNEFDEHTPRLAEDGFALAFSTHVIEHVFDPRKFFRALRAQAAAGGLLYVEVPEHGLYDIGRLIECNLISSQHLNYWTLRGLRSVAESCGWNVVRSDSSFFGFVPRARLLLRAECWPQAAQYTARVLAVQDRIAEAFANDLLAARSEQPIALWGVGGDLHQAASAVPALAAAIQQGQIVLFDRDHAGATWLGVKIHAPDELRVFGGPIWLTSRPALSRAAIMRAAATMAIQNVFDWYATKTYEDLA